MSKSKQDAPSHEAIDPGHLYTDGQAADFLGVTAFTVRNMRRDGRIGHVKISPERGRRISGRQILDYIEANSVPPEQ